MFSQALQYGDETGDKTMNLNLSFAEEFLLSNSTCRNLNNLLSLNKNKFISTLLTFTLLKMELCPM